ncbi:MAG: c-type cytochrome [Nitrospirae bacterium]|nr:c-type cytochrome [Nitrospirota bacterium]
MYSRFYLSVLLISGLLVLAYLGFTAYDSFMPEWMSYQFEYRDYLTKNAKDDAAKKLARALPLEFTQVYLGEMNKVDRCTNCHMGVENPLMENTRLPYKKHSGNYLVNHPVDKFGCTVCHEGQGSATNTKEAHGKGHDTHWDTPILPLAYVQSSCAQCHDTNMLSKSGGDKVAKGEALFMEKGCKGCHKLKGVGGDLGKPLDKVGRQPIAYFTMKHIVGEHTVFNWLKQHFDDPRAIAPDSAMKVKLGEGEADLLTTYMLTLRPDEKPKSYRRINFNEPPVQNGETLYKSYCSACHGDGKKSLYDEVFKRTVPAIMNPSLLKVMDDTNLDKILKEGRTGTQMTAWKKTAAGLTDEQIKEIVTYMAANRPADRPEPFRLAEFKGDLSHGKEVYDLRCAVCHGTNGKGGEDMLGVSLRSKVVQKMIDPEVLAITVRDGRADTPMPAFGSDPFGMSKQDIADVVAYIKDFQSGGGK